MGPPSVMTVAEQTEKRRFTFPTPPKTGSATSREGSSAKTTGKRKFALLTQAPKIVPTIPRASECVTNRLPILPVPRGVQRRLAAGQCFIGIDVETHAKAQPVPRWIDGQFGFKTKVGRACLEELRVIELGWSVGTLDCEQPLVKSYLIQPDGFEVSADATEIHSISHSMAVGGRPLREVLEQFVTDVFPLCKSGARVVAHHLEFDAGLLRNEFVRAGLDHCIEEWSRIVREGVCTMDPDVVHWCRESMGIDMPRFIPWSLERLVIELRLTNRATVQNYHRAGEDARMHWILGCELVRRSRSA